jgi:hypothetical protein
MNLLAGNIPLNLIIVTDFDLLTKIDHRLTPCGPMPSPCLPMSGYSQKVGVLVVERIEYSLFVLEHLVRKTDRSLSVVSQTRGHSISPPH